MEKNGMKETKSNGKVNRYKLVAYLIDPDAEFQKASLGKMYEKSLKDFQTVEKGGRKAIETMLKYKFDTGETEVTETFQADEEYIIDRDGDGFYLYRRID